MRGKSEEKETRNEVIHVNDISTSRGPAQRTIVSQIINLAVRKKVSERLIAPENSPRNNVSSFEV